jgi:ABC-type uncharacterized transport system permease subunit
VCSGADLKNQISHQSEEYLCIFANQIAGNQQLEEALAKLFELHVLRFFCFIPSSVIYGLFGIYFLLQSGSNLNFATVASFPFLCIASATGAKSAPVETVFMIMMKQTCFDFLQVQQQPFQYFH